MSDTVNPVEATSETQAQEQTAQAAPSGGASNMPAKLSTMDQLRDYSPESKEVYDKMMLGIATNIVNEIKDHAERLKKQWREMRQA